jgi:O-acetyl-ADP-ribose deacetylase (regulator of RNase III)
VTQRPTLLDVIQGDITTLAVDAIVNAANSSLMGGGGVDGAIHRAGGPAILEDCEAIVARHGPCRPGDAVVTGAGDLPAGLVIHTVGPIWTGDRADEHDRTLASCYRRSLELGAEHNVRSIAFPNIGTGVYRFPRPRAARVAVEAVIDWLEAAGDHPIGTVTFCCFDDENLALYDTLLGH